MYDGSHLYLVQKLQISLGNSVYSFKKTELLEWWFLCQVGLSPECASAALHRATWFLKNKNKKNNV